VAKRERISKRVIRALFGKKEGLSKPRDMNASDVICPEKVVPQHGKPPPRRTTGKVESRKKPYLEELPGGIMHYAFASPPSSKKNTVITRDPITRRLSRKKLNDGLKRTTRFYHPDGTLFDETRADW